MPNSHPIIEFTIIIESDSQNFSDWELNELALGLREELFEYGANAKLAKRKGGVPQNAKAGDPITIGAIILALAAPTIPNILSIIQNWLLRQKDQTIRVRIGEVDIEVP
ncbi:MAG: hypothetical protein KC415_20050, partial [Anaerolineales bacterium]|nr:hypothetical protein [Anaerolineales bacterium]